jgi:outer membrane protein OmpA-like peptidoglycan-associated protein
MRKATAAVLAVLVLAGCATTPHRTYLPPPPSTQPALPPPPPATTLNGQPYHPARPVPSYAGTAGPLKQADVGRYMDGMEKDLRHYLHGLPVARPGDMLSLNLASDALFEKGGTLSEDGRDILKSLSAALRHYDRTLVQVNGYTDTRGTPDQNLKTSQKRADAVAAALRADGVDGRRLTATGYGRTHLKIVTGDGKSEPRNRRVEIRILPHPG